MAAGMAAGQTPTAMPSVPPTPTSTAPPPVPPASASPPTSPDPQPLVTVPTPIVPPAGAVGTQGTGVPPADYAQAGNGNSVRNSSRRWLVAAIVAAVLVVGLAAGLVYVLTSRNTPTPQASVFSTKLVPPTRSTHHTSTTLRFSTTTTTPLINEQQAARTLSTLLSQSVVDRSEINAASNDVTTCGPTLSQDSQTFDAASSSRQSLLTQLSALPGVSALSPRWSSP